MTRNTSVVFSNFYPTVVEGSIFMQTIFTLTYFQGQTLLTQEYIILNGISIHWRPLALQFWNWHQTLADRDGLLSMTFTVTFNEIIIRNYQMEMSLYETTFQNSTCHIFVSFYSSITIWIGQKFGGWQFESDNELGRCTKHFLSIVYHECRILLYLFHK